LRHSIGPTRGGILLPVTRNLLLALVALLLSLGIGEVVVRQLHLAPEVTRIEIRTPWAVFVPSANDVLLYEPKPNTRDINAYGVRDFPFAVEKPAGTFRIVVLGDSIGFGFCNDRQPLAVEDTFAKVLERDLRRRFPAQPIEVLNLSVSGYDTVQEVEFLSRKGLPLHPDLVLLAYCLNDAWSASAETFAFERRGLGRLMGSSEIFQQVYLGSDLVRFAMQRGQVLSAKRRGKRGPGQVDRTAIGCGRLAQLGAEHGFGVVVAAFPAFENWEPSAREGEHTAVAAKAAAEGFAFLDLLPPFRAASNGRFRVLQGRCNREHPDEQGHLVAARAIEAFLVERGLVPQPSQKAP
jgi:lysophospholipase L1-like esterase